MKKKKTTKAATKKVVAARSKVKTERVTEKMAQEATCTNEQKVLAHLNPKTSTGRPAEVESGSITWTKQSGEATNEAGPDEKSQWLVSSDTPGDTVYVVSADADLGEGVETIQDVVTLKVSGAKAESLGLTLDAPVAK